MSVRSGRAKRDGAASADACVVDIVRLFFLNKYSPALCLSLSLFFVFPVRYWTLFDGVCGIYSEPRLGSPSDEAFAGHVDPGNAISTVCVLFVPRLRLCLHPERWPNRIPISLGEILDRALSAGRKSRMMNATKQKYIVYIRI